MVAVFGRVVLVIVWIAEALVCVQSPLSIHVRRSLSGQYVSAAPEDMEKSELEEMVKALQAENAALKENAIKNAPKESFQVQEVSKMAAFAFESYNAPDGARWERGADGCDVAFSSVSFLRQCYDGALRLKLKSAKNLPEQRELPEVALTGSGSDPYVLFTVVDESPFKKHALNATDVARSSTIWRRDNKDQVEWKDEEFTLFVRDPKEAQLAVTVMDEDVTSNDDLLGIGSVRLSAQTRAETHLSLGLISPRDTGIKIDPRFGVAGAVAAGALGVATGGVAIAAVAAGLAAGATQSTPKPTVEFSLEYIKFNSDEDVLQLAPTLEIKDDYDIPQGASPGVDWQSLCADDQSYNYEPLCFVDNRQSGTQAGIWRDTDRKKILVAFRGTSEARDIITDASAIMTPFARAASIELGDDHDDSVPLALGDPNVHAGFRSALDSIARRLKQLLMIALDDTPDTWELELTGHSLGGALATLFALDVVAGVDANRALPVRPQVGRSWFDPRRLFVTTTTDKQAIDSNSESLPRFRDISLLTFGAPRAGDAAFASALDVCVKRFYRVVNDQDLVARLPRGFSYNHAGSTVLVDDDPRQPALWVEGVDSGECPLKLTDAARRDTNILSSPLADGSALVALVDAVMSDTNMIEFNASAFNPFDAAARIRDVAMDTLTSPSEIAALMGVDKGYADLELKLFNALTSGDAIRHHLEPAYFTAVARASGRPTISLEEASVTADAKVNVSIAAAEDLESSAVISSVYEAKKNVSSSALHDKIQKAKEKAVSKNRDRTSSQVSLDSTELDTEKKSDPIESTRGDDQFGLLSKLRLGRRRDPAASSSESSSSNLLQKIEASFSAAPDDNEPPYNATYW